MSTNSSKIPLADQSEKLVKRYVNNTIRDQSERGSLKFVQKTCSKYNNETLIIHEENTKEIDSVNESGKLIQISLIFACTNFNFDSPVK